MNPIKRRSFNFVRSCALLAVSLSVSAVDARDCALVPSDVANIETFELGEQLREGKFAEVESALLKRHQKNLSAEGGDLLTLRDISEVIQLSGGETNVIRMWADQRAQSFFSQLAAGIYFANNAASVLGGRPTSQATPSQLKTMQGLQQTAETHLQNAIRLDQKSALPHSIMLGIAQTKVPASGQSATQWLQTANSIDPKNLAARINAVNFLSPRWGGSFELLDQMTAQADKSLSTQSAHYLRYNVQLAKASHEEVITKNKSLSHPLYKRALEMCANSKAARDGSIRTYQ
jgi:hypothetical protein